MKVEPTVTISTTGTFTKEDFPMLRFKSGKHGFAFSGATLPTTLEVGFVNPAGTFIPFTDGEVTELPTTFIANSQPLQGYALRVTGGTPSFQMDDAGPSGNVGHTT